ncbi:NAD(P)H-binding protein [Apibacter raozihei]|uniref:NAD(P)H-binding protein n=1 Tax=Apibacter raozihei TaxID=2500547 RepID=UPI000FE32899|nr:NAD(P)H-binding protein [Apibacter raozihei]
MPKILIIGATGSLARPVIQALKKDKFNTITLFARNPEKLSVKETENCTLIKGDAMNYPDIEKAMIGQDIVYVNLSGDLEAMINNCIRAMKASGVYRIVAVSSIGIYDQPLKSILLPYRILTDLIESSGLKYTILRPNWFTNEDEINYQITRKGEPETGNALSRKSIADFISRIINDPGLYVNENLGISKPD